MADRKIKDESRLLAVLFFLGTVQIDNRAPVVYCSYAGYYFRKGMMAKETQRKKRARIDIREMEIDDISYVYHLGEKLFTSEEYPILYRTWDPFEVTDAFTSDPEYCLVAEKDDDGTIVGFILATTIEKQGTAWKKYGYISWIGIDEAYHRINLGQRLYRNIEQRLMKNGVRMVIADTDAENAPAIAFFNSLKFSVSGNHVWLAKTLKKKPQKGGGQSAEADNNHNNK